MRVLREGNWNLPWVRELTCPTCEALLEVDEYDLQYTNDYYGERRKFVYVCPLCKKQGEVGVKLLSQRVREALEGGKKLQRPATNGSLSNRERAQRE